ncbi:hypothetical protein ZIOFF_047476 [Zingiber officinale]|uniref:Calmodulin binding protein-like N-terminal domain-containing protein n=1 Tax=Zingiber officinale TaxID=94328 RepID=A0A8J5KVR9_ZINOF|nr:hypothetical protein ZIOFF_047476 [Zingiber officinale]
MDPEATGSSSNLKLDFNNRFPETIYTLTNIEDINHDPLQIIVADANNVDARPLLTNYLRSPKVELLVLEGDFDSKDGNWSNQEFERKMVNPRPGKRPLLVGETTAYLSDGSVAFPKVLFTDNSSWDKSGKFRIGARVVPGSYEGPRIKEAFTEPFRVKDRRGRGKTPILFDLVKHLAREAYENWDRMEEYHEPPPNTDIPLQPNAEMAQSAMDSSLFDFGQDCYFPFPSSFGGPMDPLP